MTPSNQARALVLSRIRAGLGVAGRDRAREAAVEERLRTHPRGTIPARAHASREALLELMTTMLAAQGAEVTRAATPEDAVRAVAEDLRNHELPSRLRMGADAQLAALPWDMMPEVERVFGPANGEDRAACRARSPPRRRPGPWSSSQGPTIRRRSPSCLRPISF